MTQFAFYQSVVDCFFSTGSNLFFFIMNHATPERDSFERDISRLLENSVGLNHLCFIKKKIGVFFELSNQITNMVSVSAKNLDQRKDCAPLFYNSVSFSVG